MAIEVSGNGDMYAISTSDFSSSEYMYAISTSDFGASIILTQMCLLARCFQHAQSIPSVLLLATPMHADIIWFLGNAGSQRTRL